MHHEALAERDRASFFAMFLAVVAATMLVVSMLKVPSVAQAQDQYDCASFGSQDSAQAELDRDPSDPSNLAPTTMVQPARTTTTALREAALRVRMAKGTESSIAQTSQPGDKRKRS